MKFRNNPRAVQVAYVFLAICVVMSALANVFAKFAARYNNTMGKNIYLTNPFWFGQLIALAVQAVFWVFVLRKLSLLVALPILSLRFVLGYAAAIGIFSEKLTLPQSFGAILIMTGVILASTGTLRND